MATVLMGWELCGSLGHVMSMLAVARRLRDLGHRCVFALRDVVGPAQLLRGEGFSVVPAPLWQARRGRDDRAPPIASFADILINRSFADEGHVTANLAAWDGLIEALVPRRRWRGASSAASPTEQPDACRRTMPAPHRRRPIGPNPVASDSLSGPWLPTGLRAAVGGKASQGLSGATSRQNNAYRPNNAYRRWTGSWLAGIALWRSADHVNPVCRLK